MKILRVAMLKNLSVAWLNQTLALLGSISGMSSMSEPLPETRALASKSKTLKTSKILINLINVKKTPIFRLVTGFVKTTLREFQENYKTPVKII